MAGTRLFLILPLVFAACGDNTAGIGTAGDDAVPAGPVMVSAHVAAPGVLPTIIFQDQTGTSVAVTRDYSASADLPDGGTVIVYWYLCAIGENRCDAAAWAVRGVEPGDTITTRDRTDTTGPHIQVEPGPVQSAIMDCHGGWTFGAKTPVSEDISLLVLGPYPQTFPALPPDVANFDPSIRWGTSSITCP